MKILFTPLCLAALTSAALVSAPAALAGPAPVLTIENFVGRLDIQTSPNADFDVLEQSNSSSVSYEDTGSSLSVNGNIKKPNTDNCSGYYASWSFSNGFKTKEGQSGGYKNLDDFPSLKITAPDNVKIVTRNSIIIGKAGNVGAVDIHDKYCSRLEVGDIDADAVVKLTGSGDFTAANAGSLSLSIRGSGDAKFNRVGAADISVGGSGDVDIKQSGPTNIDLGGSGDITIDRVSGALDVVTRGSGDVDIGDTDSDVKLVASGSSDIEIDEVTAALYIQSSGSSSIDIDGGNAKPVDIRVMGSGTVDFDGTASEADLRASGSGDIYIVRVIGNPRTRESGSGDINIDTYED